MAVGRKLKLTPEVQARIVEALGVGAHHEHAAQYGGISVECFYNWMRQGESGKEPFLQFFQAVKNAESLAGVGYLALIDAAARAGNWQAAAWKLERRWPKLYGRQVIREDGEAAQLPDIHVHIHTARERLEARLNHLSLRHAEDAPHDTA